MLQIPSWPRAARIAAAVTRIVGWVSARLRQPLEQDHGAIRFTQVQGVKLLAPYILRVAGYADWTDPRLHEDDDVCGGGAISATSEVRGDWRPTDGLCTRNLPIFSNGAVSRTTSYYRHSRLKAYRDQWCPLYPCRDWRFLECYSCRASCRWGSFDSAVERTFRLFVCIRSQIHRQAQQNQAQLRYRW